MADGIDQFDTEQAPDPALLAGAVHKFKGKPLAAYSFGRRLIARDILKPPHLPVDSVWTLATVYVLTLSEEDARAALFDGAKFRADLFTWIEALEKDDYRAALDLADKIIAEAKAAEVRTVSDPAAALGEKKTT
jgi:hypothetical protein